VAFYVYDEADHLLGEYDVNGSPLYEVIWLGDLPLGVIKQTKTGNLVSTRIDDIYTDHLNAPRVITRGSDQAILWRWESTEPFGSTPANDNPSALSTYPFNLRFPGQVFDKETGLFQNHHRDYDPYVGRYIQSDPIGLQGGINTYGYVGGNPISYVDPMGLAQCSVVFVNGSGRMICIPDDSSHASVDILVASGNNGGGTHCKNNPTCENIPSRGPIPSGDWRWNINGPGSANNKQDGHRLVPLLGTNTHGRSGFLTHSCPNAFGPSVNSPFCSEGCITGSSTNMQKLNMLLGQEPNSTLHVGP
jgi:RHS repeat-associated protein